VLDAARFAGTTIATVPATWSVGIGDDAAHALFFARRVSGRVEYTVFELEADRAPIEVRRADGEPFTEVEASVRAAGHWFLATPPGPDGATVLWQLDGPVARELLRVPRAGMDGRPTGTRLARRADGRAIGLVVDGQPSPERSTPLRWVLPIDLESATAGEPELLGASDFSDRAEVPICADDDAGWVLDVPWNVSARVSVVGQDAGTMHSLFARMHLTPGRACIERLSGSLDGVTAERAQILTRSGGAAKSPAAGPALSTSALAARARYPLRCTYR
jgi:hypothetical protein